ncbi:hypothetical protein [Halalkalibacter oceani]|uniref:hypothetical protein n=1 Tax=Halalkalibacter oceani TaxID=1653776 RepID=UPI00339275B5
MKKEINKRLIDTHGLVVKQVHNNIYEVLKDRYGINFKGHYMSVDDLILTLNDGAYQIAVLDENNSLIIST